MKLIIPILYLSFICFSYANSDSNMSDFKNPNEEIEQLQVQAYNLDLGIGVEQDQVKANELYLKASLLGDPRSMLNLSINLCGGAGIEKNLVEAYAWADVARYFTQHINDMKMKWRIRGLYDELKSELNKAQLIEGEKRASEIIEKINSR